MIPRTGGFHTPKKTLVLEPIEHQRMNPWDIWAKRKGTKRCECFGAFELLDWFSGFWRGGFGRGISVARLADRG